MRAGYLPVMRIVIVGATGNVGLGLLRRLGRGGELDLVGVARRHPGPDAGAPYDAVRWHSCDIGAPDAVETLAGIFSGAQVVVHLAWQIQPSHDQAALRRTNVDGSLAVVRAVLRAGVPALVYASSVGAYAPGPTDGLIDESWPVTGVRGSSYSRQKAVVESILDQVEAARPELRVVRMRPGLVFQREAGAEIGRYFLGPLVPVRLLRHGRLPLVPTNRRLRMQAVHADDLADAYARAILGDARGAFNCAADPVLTPELVAEHLHGRTVPVPGAVLRAAARWSWRARLQPVDAGWVELGLAAPLMSSQRASVELGWRPSVDAMTALRQLLAGVAERSPADDPPLSGAARLPGRFGGLVQGRVPGHGNPY